MDRRYRDSRDIPARLRRAGAAMATTDGRWAMVSTGLTFLVAGAVTLLAMGTMPTASPKVGIPSHIPLSYELFRLIRNGGVEPPPRDIVVQEADTNPGVETRIVTLDPGDTLGGMLEDVGISGTDANAAIQALRSQFNPRALKAGQSFEITYSVARTIDATGAPVKTAVPAKPRTTVIIVNHKPVTVPVNAEDDGTPGSSETISRLLSVHFSPSIEQDINVVRTTEGDFTAQVARKKLEMHRHRAGATIDSSLYLSAMQAGIPAEVVVDMIRMFSYKVDFQRDLHTGDSFEVYYDYYYTPEGQPAKYGAISYARMRLDGVDTALYRFQTDPEEPADYFDAKGQSAKGMLMKTPVDGARISSGFGSRFHPILGYTRMHKGVDFAVPSGTPVMAAGAGTIAIMGRERGYGNFVKINHGNGYATGYAHLARFAPGLRSGAKVRQGQIFAFSGMTGMATGPHLHYEIFQNGGQVNPLKVKMAQGRTLTGSQLRAFLEQRGKTDAVVAATPLETKVADLSTDLRQARAK